MAKNRVKTLADILLSSRSSAYKELCAISTDEHGFQSNKAAADLRDELKTVITELLRGNFELVNAKLADHVQHAPTGVSVRPISAKKMVRSLNTRFTKIHIAEKPAYFVEERPDTATPAELVYGLLRHALESDDIQRLALCRQCKKIFYRKSLKKDFCSDSCRIYFNNHSEDRARRYVLGKWYPD